MPRQQTAQPSQDQVIPGSLILAIPSQQPSQKPARSRKPQGLGNPQAKKLVNPQVTLELKKSAAAGTGSLLTWQARSWVLIYQDQTRVQISSRELAALSLADFLSRYCNPSTSPCYLYQDKNLIPAQTRV
jgi:hypothetical protein